MVTVKHKGLNIITKIMEVHLIEYESKGWEVADVVATQLSEFEEIARQAIKNSGNKATDERERNATTPEVESQAIIATELKKKEDKIFTDGLLKGE